MMRVPMPARAGVVILACLSPFLFPSIVTAVLAFCAALVFPPLPILIGMLMDLLYEPAGYWPMASIVGVILCIVALLVRSFVKARIM